MDKEKCEKNTMGKDDDTGVFAHAVLRGTSAGSSADDERIFADPFGAVLK